MAIQTKKISEWLQERPTSSAYDALTRDGSIALLATADQGAKADTALQPGDAATPEQGEKADTALQPGDAATPDQGAKADTALQPTTGVYRIDTFANAPTAYIPSSVQRVFVEDRKANFKRVSADPGHPLAFQNGSQWWALDEVFPTIEMFGASGSNSASANVAPFQAAIDYLPAAGGAMYLTAANYNVTIADLDFNGKNVLWIGGERINGSTYRPLPGVNESYGHPASKRRVFYEPVGGPTDFITYDYMRVVGYDVEASSTSVSSLMRVYTNITDGSEVSGATKGEWPFQARVDNSSDSIHGVALTGQARRYGKGSTWAGHFNALDYADTSDGTPGGMWGIEANVQADGTDPDLKRRVIGIIAHSMSQSYGTPGENVTGMGLFIYTDTADFNYGIRIQAPGTPTRGRILDAAIRVDAHAPLLFHGTARDQAGVMRVGSDRTTGISTQILGIGHNDSGSEVSYSDTRTEINSSTTGSHTGILRYYVSRSGTMTELFRLHAGTTNPVSLFVDGSLKNVTVGAADSGGVGFKVLRVPN